MRDLNTAQQLYRFLGVPETKLTLGHLILKSASHTKSGPGRKHSQGKKPNHGQ